MSHIGLFSLDDLGLTCGKGKVVAFSCNLDVLVNFRAARVCFYGKLLDVACGVFASAVLRQCSHPH